MSSPANQAAPLGITAGAGPLIARLRRRESLFCATLCALWFAFTAGLRPLAIPDEGRYVGVAWEMLRSGNWWVPTLNGAPFFHKPPLFYWLTAASMSVFGRDPWPARAASVLAATFAATVLFRFVRRWRGARAGWTTVLVLATTPLFYGSSQYANLDPLVAACIAVAILCSADAVLRLERGDPARAPLFGAFAAAAFGVLAKGLIGIVLPTLVLIVWALATGRLGRAARVLRWLPGWAVFLAIAVPWFVVMQLRFADFGRYFFIVQHFDRFTSAGFNNVQPLWFYPALLAVGMAPWTPWWIALLRRPVASRPDAHGVGVLMAVWAVTITVFFSIPQSKPIGYILPVLPPLAYWIAEAVGRPPRQQGASGRRKARRDLLVVTAGFAAALCVAGAVLEHFQQPKSQAALAAQLQARRLPGESVVFLGNYYFDVPFYAGLDRPVQVADAWSAEELAKDSWRRELVDAERFVASGAPSRRILPADLPAALAPGGSAWIVGPVTAATRLPWLAAQTLVFERDGTALWQARTDRTPPAAVPLPMP